MEVVLRMQLQEEESKRKEAEGASRALAEQLQQVEKVNVKLQKTVAGLREDQQVKIQEILKGEERSRALFLRNMEVEKTTQDQKLQITVLERQLKACS